jgi:NAD(P)H-nitrite reductase large subunit
MKRHLILGNGGASITVAKTIRSVNASDKITIISKEGCCAYSPALVTYYLSGKINRNGVFMCDESFYQKHNIHPVFNTRPTGVDTKRKVVHIDGNEAFD